MADDTNLSVTAQPRYAYVRGLLMHDIPPPARVVEFGSAPGDQISALARLGYDATSVDLGEAKDEWGAGEAGRFDRLLAESGVASVIWNLEALPYPLGDCAFDAAILTEVLEHLRDYPARSLAEIRRVLRPGGRLYLTTPNSAYLVKRLALLRGSSVHTPLHDWIGGLPHARHAREYTFGEVRHLLEHVGFHIVREESRHFYLDSGRRSLPARITKRFIDGLARTRRTLGPSIIVVAEKTAE